MDGTLWKYNSDWSCVFICIYSICTCLLLFWMALRVIQTFISSYTQIFLQLTTSTTQTYIPFLKLERYYEGYSFSVHGTLKSIKVVGGLFLKLYINWPGLVIKHTLLSDEIPWPTKIRLTYSQASNIRTAMRTNTNTFYPVFYAHRYGDMNPALVYLDYSKNEQTQIAAEPNAPEFDKPRLYPAV